MITLTDTLQMLSDRIIVGFTTDNGFVVSVLPVGYKLTDCLGDSVNCVTLALLKQRIPPMSRVKALRFLN